MFLNGGKNLAIAGAFLVITAVAVAGWVHKTSPAEAFSNPPVMAATAQAYPAPEVSQSGAVPSGYQMAAYAEDGYYSSIQRPVCVRPAAPAQAYYAQPATPEYVDSGSYVSRPVYRTQRRRRGRSTEKSVAIVAGSAGVGAAIGAIAGGGKGAGIGALSGGAVGFTYDRLTHNH
jgi:hypothetical protein